MLYFSKVYSLRFLTYTVLGLNIFLNSLGYIEEDPYTQIEYYEKCIEVSPDEPESCINNLSIAYKEIGEVAKGEQLMKYSHYHLLRIALWTFFSHRHHQG